MASLIIALSSFEEYFGLSMCFKKFMRVFRDFEKFDKIHRVLRRYEKFEGVECNLIAASESDDGLIFLGGEIVLTDFFRGLGGPLPHVCIAKIFYFGENRLP